MNYINVANLMLAGFVNLAAFIGAFFVVRERLARLEEKTKSLQIQMNQERQDRSNDMKELKDMITKLDGKIDQMSQKIHDLDIKVHSNY
jgi:flagellar biosynthesis/type III secretory pathway M-ring protein FliF/YscJ